VNGRELPPVDLANPVADIGQWLALGENELTIVVPTTMWNYLRSISDQLLNSGGPPLQITDTGLKFPVPLTTDNGLMGSVIITPYTKLSLV
jgi:hypothetical protein